MFESMSEKQIRERMRFLTDKMDTLWDSLLPKLKEFDELKVEFGELYSELNKRGVFTDET